MGRIKQLAQVYSLWGPKIDYAQAPQQKRIVTDVDKRLNILFDLLNNDEIPAAVMSELVRLAQGILPFI